jgi:acyl-CoA thioesterase
MQAYGLKSIDIKTNANDIIIELTGQFIDTRYSLARIDVQPRYSGIELIIITDFDQTKPICADKTPFKKCILVTSLQAGIYYVRVNNNNNWIKWFKIANAAVQGASAAQLQY